jgi:YggT family protein
MDFLLQLVLLALSIYSWIIIAGVILSLLVGFRVINGYRPEVRSIQRTLDGLIEPVLSPIRRRLPPFGGLDLSPVVALLGINVIQILIEKIRFGIFF